MLTSLYNGYKVNLVQTLDDFNLMKSRLNPDVIVGLDSETSGLDYNNDSVAGWCISLGTSYSMSDYQGYYIPVDHYNYQNFPKDVLYPFLQSILNQNKVFFFNRNFDATFLEKEGLSVPFLGHLHDVQIMAHLVAGESFPALKPSVKKYLKFDVIDFSENNAKDHNFKTTDPTVSYIYACFSHDTKFFTRHGWRFFDEVSEGEEIGQYNPESGQIEFVHPLCRYDFIADEVLEVKTPSVSMMVTPNHRVWGRSNIKESWRVAEASSWYGKSMQLQSSSNGFTGRITPEFEFCIAPFTYLAISSKDMFSLVGFVLGNETVCITESCIRLHLRNINPHSVLWFKNLNLRLGDIFSEISPNVWSCALKEFTEWFKVNLYKKIIPDWILSGSLDERKSFIEGFCASNDSSMHNQIDVSDKGLAEQILYVITSVGYACNMFCININDSLYYRILINEHSDVIDVPSNSWRKETNKRVVCFSVPSSYLIVQRDYTTYISGNCQDPLVTVLLGRKLWSEYPYIRKIYPIDNKSGEAFRRLSNNTLLYIDKSIINSELERVNSQLIEVKNKIFSFVGYQFKLNSNKDKADALSRYVTLTRKTKGGQFEVGKDTLSKIDHPLARMLEDYAKLEKFRGSYVSKMAEFPDSFHINYSTVNVSTGRTSSGSSKGNSYFANFNIQNVPKVEKIRFIWRDDFLGYSVNDNRNLLVEGDGEEAELYELELEDGTIVKVDGESSVKIERDGKIQYSQVKNLTTTDILISK